MRLESGIASRRPSIPLALAYTTGILVGWRVALPLWWLFCASFIVGAVALALPRLRGWLLVALLAVAGWTNFVFRTAILSPYDLRTLPGEREAMVVLRGRLDEPPVRRLRMGRLQPRWHSAARVAAEAIQLEGKWLPASGLVLASTPGILSEDFFATRAVEIRGVIHQPPGAVAEGLFDYRAYLRWQGVFHQLETESTNDWCLPATQEPARPPLASRFGDWALATLAAGLPEQDESLRLLWAMTLGWKTALTDEVSEPFMQTGTMHIFAVSGLHISLITGILVVLLRVLQVPRQVCGLVVVPLIWFYTAAVGWQASAIRSTIMMTVIVAGWSLKRPSDLLNSLAASALIVLLWDPRQLFQASFQLSFFVVLSIALLMPPIESGLEQALQPDPFLPPETLPGWRHFLLGPVRWLGLSLATSLAAWCGSMPLIAWYFNLVTPVSLLVNVVAVPLSSLALMASLGSLVCGAWARPVAELFNHSAWLWMDWMVAICRWAATLPAAYFYVPTPTPVFTALFYLMLIGLFSGWLLARKRRKWVLICGAALALGGGAWWLWAPKEARISVIAREGSTAIYSDQPGGARDMLIDCGRERDAERVVTPFLRAKGVNRLEWLALTHGDVAHVEGAEFIMDELAVRKVVASHARGRSPSYRRVLRRLETEPDRSLRVRAGDTVAGWSVLHPDERASMPMADDNTLVLRGDFAGVRVLLLSDLSRAGQESLMSREADLRADLLVLDVSRGAQPPVAEFLSAVHPSAVIVNDAGQHLYERAGSQARRLLFSLGVPIIYTSKAGSATIRVKSGRWEIRTMSGDRVNPAPRAGRM